MPKPFDCFYQKCDLKNYTLDETLGSFEIYHKLALAQMTLILNNGMEGKVVGSRLIRCV